MSEAHSTSLGYVFDPQDDRDLAWRQTVLLARVPLPKKFKRKRLGKVLNQGPDPHCVAFAAASLKMHHEKREHGIYPSFSTSWLYHLCKQQDGIPDVDGTFLRVAFQIIQEHGYRAKSGQHFKIDKYVRLHSVQQIKEAIYIYGPVAFGIMVDSGIFNVSNTGLVAEPNDDTAGGHAMLAVGFDDEFPCEGSTGAFLVKNSWGNTYGNKGYIWLPYSHFSHYPGWDAWRTTDIIETDGQVT